MTEEEKRFKILKKESYEELVKREGGKSSNAAVLVGLFASLSILTLSSEITNELDFMYHLLGHASVVAGAVNLKELINSICKKTMYESKIEDIDRELEMLEQNESRGMKR